MYKNEMEELALFEPKTFWS